MNITGLSSTGFRYAMWRGRLSSVQYCDPDADRVVWFVKDLDRREIVGNFRLKSEAVLFIESQGFGDG